MRPSLRNKASRLTERKERNGESASSLQKSPNLHGHGSAASPEGIRSRIRGSDTRISGSSEMGLQRTEKDNSAGAVAPEDRRRCLRGSQRRSRRPGHRRGRIVRLERLRSSRRSQQDHHWVLL